MKAKRDGFASILPSASFMESHGLARGKLGGAPVACLTPYAFDLLPNNVETLLCINSLILGTHMQHEFVRV